MLCKKKKIHVTITSLIKVIMKYAMNESDVLVIGSGAAGMTLALQLDRKFRVSMLCKDEPMEGSTYYAQGGVAAVLGEYDSISSHVADTLDVGVGLCNPEIVAFTVKQSADIISWLVELGVNFDTKVDTDGSTAFHLTKEGGHSHRRVIHAADATGKEIALTLSQHLESRSNVTLFPKYVAVDLITKDSLGLGGKDCIGAYALNLTTKKVEIFRAKHVVIASGGASKVYQYTSNPDTASGDGIAMCWRAGCRVGNLEFNQFHPTCLFHPKAKSFLISESLRGEGAHLLLPSGERFMHKYDERKELAPRDIVARAIDHEMKKLGCNFVLLDISHKGKKFVKKHFPNIFSRCLELGIDITKEPMPIVPAAHYTCGGVVIDKNGKTDLPGLYAIGESSFSGLHGANRMASNSLLECMVFAKSAAKHIQNSPGSLPEQLRIPAWDDTQVVSSDEEITVSHNWKELRALMWDYVGIVRTDKRLQRARRRIRLLQQEIEEHYSNYQISSDFLELRNLACVADLMVRCALQRRESRGLHFTLDYPEQSEELKDSILTPSSFN
mgnify:CR=1 FL=1